MLLTPLQGRHRRQGAAGPRPARRSPGSVDLPLADGGRHCPCQTAHLRHGQVDQRPDALRRDPLVLEQPPQCRPDLGVATCTACSAAARSCSCSSTCAVASSTRRSRATRSWSNADRRSRAFAIPCCLLDTFDATWSPLPHVPQRPQRPRLPPAHHHRPPT